MNEEKSNLPSCDIFSLGLTLYELCSCKSLPLSGKEWHELRQGILNRKMDVSPYLQLLIKVYFI